MAPNGALSRQPDPKNSIPASTRLRHQLAESNRLIVCPGVYDGFSARIAIDVGFDALYMTGAGTTASRLGHADLGIAQLADMRANAEMIANLDNSVPLIADMDTGFGSPIMVARSVSEYIRAGVAGFHIEDQILAKRCGHLQGKEVVDIETFVSRIKAARMAIDQLHSDIVLIGRTDSLQQHGYEEAVTRIKAARDAGADVGLLEGVTSREMAAQAVKDLAPFPLLLNMVENGSTPIMRASEVEAMGYRIMIFSFASLSPAYKGIRATLERLKMEGVTGTDKELTPKKLFDICGLQESVEVDVTAGGDAFTKSKL
ncbi:MAG: hypothetical protein Q9191_002867 [Dirinaria sp. TL-2023a]